METIQEYSIMTTPQEDAELRDQLSDLRKMIYTITPDSVDDAKLDKIVQWVSGIILDRDEQREREIRMNELTVFDNSGAMNDSDAAHDYYLSRIATLTNPQQQDQEEE